MAVVPTAACSQCGQEHTLLSRDRRDRYRRTGRAYCSDACKWAYLRAEVAARMAATNKRHAAARMKARNPMARPESREKMRGTLKAIGHRPPVRGGNGKGLTVPQSHLAQALGWDTEVIVRTGQRRVNAEHLPSHYKLDIADRALKVAIEVDGGSHAMRERQEQDAKKTAFLSSRGWTVLRFSNRDVMERLEACVQTVMSTTSKLKGSTPTSPTAS